MEFLLKLKIVATRGSVDIVSFISLCNCHNIAIKYIGKSSCIKQKPMFSPFANVSYAQRYDIRENTNAWAVCVFSLSASYRHIDHPEVVVLSV